MEIGNQTRLLTSWYFKLSFWQSRQQLFKYNDFLHQRNCCCNSIAMCNDLRCMPWLHILFSAVKLLHTTKRNVFSDCTKTYNTRTLFFFAIKTIFLTMRRLLLFPWCLKELPQACMYAFTYTLVGSGCTCILSLITNWPRRKLIGH